MDSVITNTIDLPTDFSTKIMTENDPYSFLNINLDKWVALTVLTLSSILFGLLPYVLFTVNRLKFSYTPTRRLNSSRKNYSTCILSIFSSLSGGILLATTMLHILPEVREKAKKHFHETPEDNNHHDILYHLAEMLTLLGFCLIYFMEQIAHLLLPKIAKTKTNVHYHNHHMQTNLEQNHLQKDTKSIHRLMHSLSDEGISVNSGSALSSVSPEDFQIKSSCEHKVHNFTETPHNGNESLEQVRKLSTSYRMSTWRTLISLIALSLHAILEGIAIGLQDSSNLWITFGAVGSHKLIISFCLGLELVKSKVNYETLFGSVATFSLVSPLGILIGSGLSTAQEFCHSDFLLLLEGLACGTLLYVVFFEILAPHKHGHNHYHNQKVQNSNNYTGIFQFFGTFTGIMLTAYLISLNPHNHEKPELDQSHSH